MDKIESLADLRPGDIMFGPIGGIVPGIFPVGLGQAMLGETFHAGALSVRHVGIVVGASRHLPPGSSQNLRTGEWHSGPTLPTAMPFGDEFMDYPTGVITAPRLAQAMPRGAEEISMRQDTHWTPRHAYVRLPEDYPGQAADAAAIARLFVTERVAYSPLSYAALAAWKYGLGTPRLEAWIGRRRKPIPFEGSGTHRDNGTDGFVRLPCEAICSVLADQAWSLAGKRVVQGVAHQAVTPGAMANQLRWRDGAIWSTPPLL